MGHEGFFTEGDGLLLRKEEGTGELEAWRERNQHLPPFWLLPHLLIYLIFISEVIIIM